MNAERRQRKDRNVIEIEERALRYSVRAAKLFRHLKGLKDEVGLILGRQYFRCASSIGANLAEARSGESRKDFIHKCAIAQKEARESHYWLRVMSASETIASDRLTGLLQETDELVAIITAIIRNSKKAR
jgi:four helix bundle protein